MRTRDPRKEPAIRRKALELAVRHGLDGFSMQALARAARVSPATLYIYFTDRDDLLFQVFREVMERMAAETLRGFDPEQSFAEGLRVQWLNRARYGLEHPLEFEFLEHVRHSPYHARFFPRLDPAFFDTMRAFVKNAIRRGELAPMPREVFWAVAFGPLYQLLAFHRSGRGLLRPDESGHGHVFKLDDELLELALRAVLKALKP